MGHLCANGAKLDLGTDRKDNSKLCLSTIEAYLSRYSWIGSLGSLWEQDGHCQKSPYTRLGLPKWDLIQVHARSKTTRHIIPIVSSLGIQICYYQLLERGAGKTQAECKKEQPEIYAGDDEAFLIC